MINQGTELSSFPSENKGMNDLTWTALLQHQTGDLRDPTKGYPSEICMYLNIALTLALNAAFPFTDKQFSN